MIINIHIANKNEFEQLCQIWHDEFKSSLTYINNFYHQLNATPYVLVINNEVISCLTLVNTGTYKNRNIMVSYAIATKPNFRNKSYGKKIVTYVKEKVLSDGNLSLVCPAEPPLVEFYKNLGYKSTFYTNEIKCNKTKNSNIAINQINKLQYQKRREEFLKNYSHVSIKESLLSFVQNKNTDDQILLSINDNKAIGILDNNNNKDLYLPELIVNDSCHSDLENELTNILNGLCTFYKKETVKVRYFNTNKISNESYTQGMLSGLNNKSSEIAYYGFPMD